MLTDVSGSEPYKASATQLMIFVSSGFSFSVRVPVRAHNPWHSACRVFEWSICSLSTKV